jgi:hypothetical protein
MDEQGIHFDPEDGSSKDLRHVGNCPHGAMTQNHQQRTTMTA